MGGAQPVDLSAVARRIAVQDVLGRRQRHPGGAVAGHQQGFQGERVPADQAGVAAADIGQPHPPPLDGPEAFGQGVSVPDGVQKLAAYAIDVDRAQLCAQIVGRRRVDSAVAAGFDDEG